MSMNMPAPAPLIMSAINLGLPVFPCGRNKKPCISKDEGGHGFQDATQDIPRIEEMFSHRGARLIGVPTGLASGFDALDLDYRNGAAAFEEANRHRMPETRIHETQSGGRHLVFLHAPGVRNSAGSIAPGVDVRGDGGYLVFPPSPNYRIISEADPCHWPDWLLELVLPKPKPARPSQPSEPRQPVSSRYIEKVITSSLTKVRSAADGQKHYTLRDQALLLGGLQHHAGYSDDECVRWLMDALPSSVKDKRAAEQTARWGLEKGKVRPIEFEDRRADSRHKSNAEAPLSEPQSDAIDMPPDLEDSGYYESVNGDAAESEQQPPTHHQPDTDCQAAIASVIADFNGRYLVVNESGKAVIFQPGYDHALKRRHYDRLTTRDLQMLYMNQQVQVGFDDKKRSIFKGKADIWLRHPDRRQFIHGVTFDPTMQVRPGVLNLWEGYAVKPVAGDWSLLREHIERVICASDPVRFDYLMGWMARMIQRPAEQGEVAVVMQGGEGTGKGTLAKALMQITGHHGLAISNGRHLVGNFNAHLRDVIFLFADEALFAGDRAHVGALKSLITEPYLTVEGKFANAVQAPNFLHVMMASNETWVVPASQDARRFFVLEVLDSQRGNHAYFSAIWKQMEAGGFAAMLSDLLAYDLTTFNVRAVPTTDGLQRQRKLSLPTTEAWWLDCLERGYVFRSKLGMEKELSIWHSRISMELLLQSYLEFAKTHNERRILSREALGAFFATLKAEPKRWRNAVVGEHMVDVENLHGGTSRKALVMRQDRATGYLVGSLSDARASFTKTTGLAVAWDNGLASETCED